MATVADLLIEAQQARQSGDMARSESLCWLILQHAADCGPAWHLLGSICHAKGQLDEALNCHLKAASLLPDVAEVHYDLAHAYHVLGRLNEAVAAYRRAVALAPQNFAAVANLGAALQQQALLDEAAACYRRAIQLQPNFPEVYSNLGMVLKDQGQLEQALAAHHRALELNPNLPIVHANLAATLQALGRLDDAIAAYNRSLELGPSDETHFNLGTAYRQAGQIQPAIEAYQRALALNPRHAEAFNNLGVAYKEQGKLNEAIAAYQQSIALRPHYAEAHNNLGAAYFERGELQNAVPCFRRALEIKPHFVEALTNLSVALHDQDQLDAAASSLEQALSLQPDYAEARTYLGNVRKDQARLEEAVADFRRAIAKSSSSMLAHSNLCYSLQFCPGISPADNYAEHVRWREQHAAPIEKAALPHANDRNPNRRLRIGYVSPDFRNHCQAFFTTPLLAHHNHQDFEIVCYADVASPDAITARLRPYADQWRDIFGQSAAQTAELIRNDRIDILVDLTMHMKRSHLLVFAHKPAPVQICWLAYPGTTGLTAIDYRFTDPYLDPPGMFDSYYSEESIRLPDTFWCYDPLSSEPAVSGLPALTSGHITFGSLNNFCKLNDPTLDLFARILHAVPRSRLILFITPGSHRDRTGDFFAARGISADRLTFVSRQSRRAYLEQYHKIDIGLDTLPYNGHTTSLDAFWMGVPVATLVGDTVVGRAGLSQLTNLGLEGLIAYTPQDYLAIITRLASDLSSLAHLRSTLRGRMQQSPLMNAPLFTRNIEQAYRELFYRWCMK